MLQVSLHLPDITLEMKVSIGEFTKYKSIHYFRVTSNIHIIVYNYVGPCLIALVRHLNVEEDNQWSMYALEIPV